MKYAYAMIIVICLLSTTSWSAGNPMIRNCNIAGGEFVVVEVTDILTGYDQWALCKFGNAYVGALDVMYFNNQTQTSESFTQYKNGAEVCTGKIIESQILQGSTLEICQYSDDSIIEIQTLKKGLTNSDNKQLNNFLGL